METEKTSGDAPPNYTVCLNQSGKETEEAPFPLHTPPVPLSQLGRKISQTFFPSLSFPF